MIRVLIIEDEHPAAKRLKKLIAKLDDKIEILEVIDSKEDAIAWFKNNEMPDLAFFDIQLADGLSFGIFEKVEVTCPIIFTTAYDQYALKAFKVNSIDYLLKPIDPEELKKAWQKFQTIGKTTAPNLQEMLTSFQQIKERKNYKERFLIKQGGGFKYMKISEVAYFFSEDGLTFLMAKSGRKFILDEKISSLEAALDPHYFFRINRKFIVAEHSVSKISNYFNSRLKLELSPGAKDEVIISRERVGEFKKWLN